MRPLLIAVILLFAMRPEAWSSTTNAEDAFAGQIATTFSIYYKQQDGQIPDSWAGLQTWVDLQSERPRSWDTIYPTMLPTKRYAFLFKPLALPQPDRWEVVLMTRRPFWGQSA